MSLSFLLTCDAVRCSLACGHIIDNDNINIIKREHAKFKLDWLLVNLVFFL